MINLASFIYRTTRGDEKMKKAIILCCMVLCIGCESDQGSTQSVMQIVQTEKLKTQIRQLETTVEAQEAEIKQLKTKNINQEALHLEQTAKLDAQIRQLQATIEEQKIEIEQTKKIDTEEK